MAMWAFRPKFASIGDAGQGHVDPAVPVDASVRDEVAVGIESDSLSRTAPDAHDDDSVLDASPLEPERMDEADDAWPLRAGREAVVPDTTLHDATIKAERIWHVGAECENRATMVVGSEYA
jgi:hypothetical protein